MQDIQDLSTWTVHIGRVRGRWDRAALRIRPFSENREHFASGRQLVLQKDGQTRRVSILKSRSKDGGFVVECGFSGSEEADQWLGADVYIHPSMRPKLPEGEFYVDELTGFHLQTEEGEDLGEIDEIIETPANLVFASARAMVPDHPEFVVKIDAAARKVIVRDIEGIRTS